MRQRGGNLAQGQGALVESFCCRVVVKSLRPKFGKIKVGTSHGLDKCESRKPHLRDLALDDPPASSRGGHAHAVDWKVTNPLIAQPTSWPVIKLTEHNVTRDRGAFDNHGARFLQKFLNVHQTLPAVKDQFRTAASTRRKR